MPESTGTIVQQLLAGIALVAYGLGLWILNNISKTINRVEEKLTATDNYLEAKIDQVMKDRSDKWVKKEKECGDEKAVIADHEARIKHLEK